MSYFYFDASAVVKRYSPEVGADDDLITAARAEGLAIENPNLHS